MTRRQIFRVRGPEPGPTLVIVAGVHGNEPAGVEAARILGRRLEAGGGIRRGEIVAWVGNPPALAAGRRFLDRDLNRAWDGPLSAVLGSSEGQERRALTHALAALRDEARGPLHVVDVHTTSGGGPPFSIVNGCTWGRALADALPVSRITGMDHRLRGTFAGWLDAQGIRNVTLEIGGHTEPGSPLAGESLLSLTIDQLDLASGAILDLDAARARLAARTRGLPRSLHVMHRHAILPGDGFRMEPGFRNLTPVSAGDVLARDDRGPVRASSDGWVLLPLYQVQGEDGFFLVHEVTPEASAADGVASARALVREVPRHAGASSSRIATRSRRRA